MLCFNTFLNDCDIEAHFHTRPNQQCQPVLCDAQYVIGSMMPNKETSGNPIVWSHKEM